MDPDAGDCGAQHFLRDAAFADNRADSQEHDRRFLQGKQCVFSGA